MHNKENKQLSAKWLSEELRNEVKEVFEKRYKEKISEEELSEIAISLLGLVESCVKKED